MRRLTAAIGVRAYTDEARDENGDYTSGWADPVSVPVYAIAPTTSTEPGDPNRTSVITGWTVFAPIGTRIGPHDRVDLPGVDGVCEVVGEVARWDRNPHVTTTRQRGIVATVRRVDG